MKIGIGNDHHGIVLKNKIIKYLESKNIKCVNYGCDSAENKEKIDYIDYALKVCNGVNKKEVDLGILICGTGLGMSIIANKVKGIRAAKINTPKEAALAKEHNMANVITLAEYTKNYKDIVDKFIQTENSKEERHIRRVNKIKEIENEK